MFSLCAHACTIFGVFMCVCVCVSISVCVGRYPCVYLCVLTPLESRRELSLVGPPGDGITGGCELGDFDTKN